MDTIDDEEARKLAAEWLTSIKASVGLTASNDASDLGRPRTSQTLSKQVLGNYDVSNQNDHSGCPTSAYQAKDQYAEHKSTYAGNGSSEKSTAIDGNTEKLNLKSTVRQVAGNGFDIIYGQVESTKEQSQKMLATDHRGHVSTDELCDIWDFNDEQREKAKSYLQTGIANPVGFARDYIQEKENVHSLPCRTEPEVSSYDSANGVFMESPLFSFDEAFIENGSEEVKTQQKKSEIVDASYKFKICASCGEKNEVEANWCEECGKAIISAKITNGSTKEEPKLCIKNTTSDAVPIHKAFTSKLNPNCAEFVSAYSDKKKSMPLSPMSDHSMDFPNRNTPKSVPSRGFHMITEERKPLTIRQQKFANIAGQELDRSRPSSFTDGFKYESRRNRKARESERRRCNKQRISPCSIDIFNQSPNSSEAGSFKDAHDSKTYHQQNGNLHMYGSPSSFNNIYDCHGNQATFCASTVDQGQVLHDFMNPQLFYQSVDGRSADPAMTTPNLVHCPVPSQILGVSRGTQSYTYDAPVIESPQGYSTFDGAEFSKVFVQSTLQQQMENTYGNWNAPGTMNWADPRYLDFYHPQFSAPVNVGKDQYQRVYRKKRVFNSGIETPRTPKAVLPRFKSTKEKLQGNQNHKQGVEKVFLSENKNPSSEKHKPASMDASKFSPVYIPPLKLEDLDNYDQILTLIRTSRDAELPYLCLPEEILLYILSFLSKSDLCRCARVCKQFNRISMDESLWKEIVIRKNNNITDNTLECIAKKSPVSLTITQCNGSNITENGLRSLFRTCGESLQDLDFSACRGKALVGELILLHVSSRCKNLRSLDISWSNVSDIGIQAVSEAVDRLECICINGCQNVTDEAVRSIAVRHKESIRVVEMFGCFNITSVSLTILQEYCPLIETFNIGQCHKVSDAAVAGFTRKANKLENIDLRGCKQIRDNSVKVIAESCPNLSTLVVANCPMVTDASLVSIASSLKNMRCIDVCGCTKIGDRGVQALAKSCSKLQMIDFSSTKTSDRAVVSLANYCCQTLKAVKMSFCKAITEGSVEHLAKKCRKLELLHLYGCKRVKNLPRILDCNKTLVIES